MSKAYSAAALLVVMAFVSLSAAAQDPAGEYRLGPKDLLEIRVMELPDFNLERRVSDSGVIALPLIGDLQVTGLTAGEVARRIEELLRARYVNRANASVIIKEYSNRPVSVVGAVHRPGTLNVSGNWTLLQAVSAAGGMTERAGKAIFILRRGEPNGANVIEVDADELFKVSSPVWDIPIYPSDVINIPAKSFIKIYTLGEVQQPGALEFDLDDRVTVLSAIAKAGGMGDRASNRIVIKRRDASGQDTETEVNFKRIVSGKDPDPQLMADDVLVVLLSFF
ncbi:MAG TPA: polysaccharide biosynthesis/export family protein [Thermoanaerobaculia bacterium]|nr:polysaccharide biosynthesis/export family protein [Thermoanaerobaculia bacterium]